jgi:hypothetical protein
MGDLRKLAPEVGSGADASPRFWASRLATLSTLLLGNDDGTRAMNAFTT